MRLAALFRTSRVAATDAGADGIRSTSRSHVGRVRRVNEDRLLDCPDQGLWAVADGMGGHSIGALAAEMAVAALRNLCAGPARLNGAAIEAALTEANGAIVARGLAEGATAGSTVVVLHIDERRGWLAWVGDSRLYRVRDREVVQLTTDHSLVQELIDAGVLTIAQAAQHPKAHVITRALGVADEIAIAGMALDIRAGDLFLLCSDGLSRTLTGPRLADAAAQPLEAAADELLGAALRDDGSDNVSLVLVRV